MQLHAHCHDADCGWDDDPSGGQHSVGEHANPMVQPHGVLQARCTADVGNEGIRTLAGDCVDATPKAAGVAVDSGDRR